MSVAKCRPTRNRNRLLFRGMVKKTGAVTPEAMTDGQVLRVVFTERQTDGLLERLGPGGLANFTALGERGPRGLLDLPGFDEGGAAKLLAIFELAVRIS